jgi:branched-chain amino acid transport system substrate-binding protein
MISFGRNELACAAVLAVAIAATDTGCRVFSKVEDCAADADCAGNERCHPEGRFCQRVDKVVVGVILSRSASLAATSSAMESAIEYAMALVNDNGGVLGARLDVHVLDDEGDENLSAERAKTLVAEGVAAIIGPLRSAQVLKAQAVTYPAKVLELSPLGGATALAASQPAGDRYLFQTITSIRRGSASAIVRYATKPVDDPPRADPRCLKMAVLHTDDVTGNEYRDAIAALMAKNGGCVTLDVSFPPALKADYVADVKKLYDQKPECAALIALPPVGAAIVRELAKQRTGDARDWSQFRWFGTTTLHSPDFLTAARADKAKPAPSFAEGFLGADVDSAPPTAEYADFRFGWQRHFGEGTEPPNLAAQSFDALILAALAIEHAGSIHDRPRIRDGFLAVSRDGDRVPAFGPGTVGDALRAARRHERINYQGASGGIEPDDTGVVVDPTLIWRVKDGEFAPDVLRYTEEQTKSIDDPRVQPRTCP